MKRLFFPRCWGCSRLRKHSQGFTLIELLMSMLIFTLIAVVIGNLSLAVNTAWEHCDELEQKRVQSEAVHQRVEWMLSRAALYQSGNAPIQPGIRVMSRQAPDSGLEDLTSGDTLVLWCGDASGSLAGRTLNRTPVWQELVVYTWHANANSTGTSSPTSLTPTAALQLVEVTFPQLTTSIDLWATGWQTRLRQALNGSDARTNILARNLNRVMLSAESGESEKGAVAFYLQLFPSEQQLQAATTGSPEWLLLPWRSGQCTSNSGERSLMLSWEFFLAGSRQSGPNATINAFAPSTENSGPEQAFSRTLGQHVFSGSAVRSWLHAQ